MDKTCSWCAVPHDLKAGAATVAADADPASAAATSHVVTKTASVAPDMSQPRSEEAVATTDAQFSVLLRSLSASVLGGGDDVNDDVRCSCTLSASFISP